VVQSLCRRSVSPAEVRRRSVDERPDGSSAPPDDGLRTHPAALTIAGREHR
jgi:hypothetical protein